MILEVDETSRTPPLLHCSAVTQQTVELGQPLPSHSASTRINVCRPRKRPNRGQVVNDEKGQYAT
jgi:hypothetical protein